jgi:hypothetical protein
MKPNTKSKLCDAKLHDISDLHFSRLTNLYSGKALEYVFVLNGILGQSHTNPYQEPEKWLDECLDNLADHAERMIDKSVFRPLVIEYGPYGVHFVDKIFGANVYNYENQWWSDYLTSPIGNLNLPNLDNDPTWSLAKRVAKAFVESGVTIPLFGLPTLSSALNIVVNLYGEEFLLSLLMQPESAIHDLKVINDLICGIHRWYLQNIPLEQLQLVVAGWRTQPKGFGQICGCTTHLLSAEIYRDFIAPLDDEMLSVYPNGGMIHLCGVHTQHIPTWREMKSLRAIQVNDRASEDLEIYYNELRDDQIIYLNPTATMNVEKALEITGGDRLVVVAEIPQPISVRKS